MSLFFRNDKIKILVLTASPEDLNSLQVELECKEIRKALNYAKNQNKYDLIQEYKTSINDLVKLIRDFGPTIVHFSGHSQTSGIYLEDSNRKSKLVNNLALTKLFGLFAETVECVILNSCFSDKQVRYISRSIPFVIGTRNSIKDQVAIDFSKSFYSSLDEGKNYEESFELAHIMLSLDDELDNPLVIYIDGEKVKYLSNQRKSAINKKISILKSRYLFWIFAGFLLLLVLMYLLKINPSLVNTYSPQQLLSASCLNHSVGDHLPNVTIQSISYSLNGSPPITVSRNERIVVQIGDKFLLLDLQYCSNTTRSSDKLLAEATVRKGGAFDYADSRLANSPEIKVGEHLIKSFDGDWKIQSNWDRLVVALIHIHEKGREVDDRFFISFDIR